MYYDVDADIVSEFCLESFRTEADIALSLEESRLGFASAADLLFV